MGDGFSNDKLTLSKDTFSFRTFSDVGGATTFKGKWSRHGDILTLNSFNRPAFKPNSVREITGRERAKKLIVVQNLDVSAHRAVISINNGQEIDTLDHIDQKDLDTYDLFFVTGAYTNISSIKSIKILNTNNWTDCVLRDSLFYVTNPGANVIIVYAQPYNFYAGMQYMIEQQWKFVGNKIYTWHTANDKWSKTFFLKRVK